MTTIQQLSEAWNALRNAALGRGTALPAGMPSELADEVGLAFEQWRIWLDEQSALGEAQHEITLAGEGREWADRYAALAKEVSAATGKPLPETPVAPVERVATQTVEAIKPWASLVLVGAGVGLAVAALSFVRGRR